MWASLSVRGACPIKSTSVTAPATFLINKGKDVKTIQGLLRHAKASATLDLYSQAIDAYKLAAQRDIALAITSNQVEAN
jgi:hypothetical protein